MVGASVILKRGLSYSPTPYTHPPSLPHTHTYCAATPAIHPLLNCYQFSAMTLIWLCGGYLTDSSDRQGPGPQTLLHCPREEGALGRNQSHDTQITVYTAIILYLCENLPQETVHQRN